MTRRLTTQEFIEKAIAVHGDRYDYSSVDYVNNSEKVTIICPEHGRFSQKPNGHLSGKGCRKCGGRMPLTTDTFIEKAIGIHGDRYDYSSVDYVNSKTEVTVICPEHGPFPQKPVIHVNSASGCPECAGTKKLTTKRFIQKAKSVHGNRYDYSQVKYKNNRTHVTIICPEHGPFPQVPDSHLSGHGCDQCGGTAKHSTDSFIEKAVALHGHRYDYSAVAYVDSKTEVTIVCREHGPFPQRPNNHLSGEGCRYCAGKGVTTESFIETAREIHGDSYNYSQADYINSKTYVTIICPTHGPFPQIPDAHLRGIGCPKCGGRFPLTTDTFIEKAIAIHGDRYDYSSVRYVNAHEKVTITCPVHGPFPQMAYAHLGQASGCPDCSDSGFNPSEPGVLYYIAISTDDGDTRYKIGITNKTVKRRFFGEGLSRIRIVKTWRYAVGRRAAEREAEILQKYLGERYFGPPLLVSGNTEIFTHDVLGLDVRTD